MSPLQSAFLSDLRLAEQRLGEMGFDISFISIDKPELLLISVNDPEVGYTVFSNAALNAIRSF